MALTNGLSQLDMAMNDTLVAKAQGAWFEKLCAMYGLPHIPGIQQKYWRKAVIASNFAKRDSLGTLFTLCREALRGQDSVRMARVHWDPLHPEYNARLYKTADVGDPGFQEADLFRFWEIQGSIFYSIGGGAYAGGHYGYLEMCPFSGPNWRGFYSKYLAENQPGVWYDLQAARLPFLLRGVDGKAELVLEETGTSPPTYLQEFFSGTIPLVAPSLAGGAAIDLGTSPLNATLKGFSISEVETLLLLVQGTTETSPGVYDVTVINADPAYLPGSGSCYIPGEGSLCVYSGVTYAADGNTATLHGVAGAGVSLLGPGERLAVDLPNIPAGVSRQATYTATFYKGLVPVATLTLGEYDTNAMDNTTEVAVAPGDLLSCYVVRNTITGVDPSPLRNAVVSVFFAVPVDEPLGGNLMPDGTSDMPNVGPWPIYLQGSTASDWQRLLDRLVALGVQPVARTSIHLNSD